jgi:hypothetical protein
MYDRDLILKPCKFRIDVRNLEFEDRRPVGTRLRTTLTEQGHRFSAAYSEARAGGDDLGEDRRKPVGTMACHKLVESHHTVDV